MLRLKPNQVLNFVVRPEDGAFIAQCLEVDVVAEGDTEAQAIASLREALELRFEGEAVPALDWGAFRPGLTPAGH